MGLLLMIVQAEIVGYQVGVEACRDGWFPGSSQSMWQARIVSLLAVELVSRQEASNASWFTGRGRGRWQAKIVWFPGRGLEAGGREG